MRLLITDELDDEDISFDIVKMSTLEFNTECVHPFIASSNFDEIIIDTDAKVNLVYVRNLMRVSKVIPRIHGELTMQSVSILCELYKERAAELRVLFIRDKEAFNKIIEELKQTFQWETFYK